MKKYSLCLLFGIASGIAYSQNYTLPSILFDSLTVEVRRGRSCTRIDSAQRVELSRLSGVIHDQGRIIELTQKEATQLEALYVTLEQRLETTVEMYVGQVDRLRARLSRWVRLVILESGVVVAIVVILLL